MTGVFLRGRDACASTALLPRAAEDDAIVQTECAVAPEFDIHRFDTKAGPVRRARDLAEPELGDITGHGLLQRKPALQRARLLRGPGADAAVAGARLEIGVGLGVADNRDGPANPDLPAQALPVEQHCGLALAEQFLALLALGVGVEDEAIGIVALEQDHADIGQALGIDRRERHAVGIVGLGAPGLLEPFGKQRKRRIALREVTAR
jgi:hypothetical protein